MNGKNVFKQPMMQMNLLWKENFDKQVCFYSKEIKFIVQKCSFCFQGKISTPTDEQKPFPTTSRKTPTLRYHTKKANTDQQQRAKTVDVVRLKTGQ